MRVEFSESDDEIEVTEVVVGTPTGVIKRHYTYSSQQQRQQQQQPSLDAPLPDAAYGDVGDAADGIEAQSIDAPLPDAADRSADGGAGSSDSEDEWSHLWYDDPPVEASDVSTISRQVLPSYGDRSECPQIFTRHDRRAATFLFSWRGAQQIKHRYAVVEIQLTDFRDGQLMVGWCSGGPCGSDTRLFDLLAGTDQPLQPKSFVTVPPMCECARSLVDSMGGESGMRQLLQSSRPSEEQDGVICRSDLLLRRTPCTAVKAGDSVADWGIVVHGRCCTCGSSQNSCRHVKAAADASDDDSLTTMPHDQFDLQVDRVLDLDTDSFKISSISWEKRAERLEDDAEQLQLLTGDSGCTVLLPVFRGRQVCLTPSSMLRQRCIALLPSPDAAIELSQLFCTLHPLKEWACMCRARAGQIASAACLLAV